MHVLICPDKFKGSLTALEAANAIAQGLPPDVTYTLHPMADGGEGSLDIVAEHTSGYWVFCAVHDPLFRPIQARYWVSDGTAYIEMAQASGLHLVDPPDRNPCASTSYGTGELLFHALTSGYRKLVLFIGGSATVDGGVGMLAALGYRFFDEENNIISPIARNVGGIARWTEPALRFDLTVVCDVSNPLHGVTGAAEMFGPQKGASQPQVDELAEGLQQFEAKVAAEKRISWAHFPGAGAAGGVGWAALSFLNARYVGGFSFLAQVTGLEKKIKDADLVLTGEGKIDAQTWYGKVPHGVWNLAKQFQKPVIAFCGRQEVESHIPMYSVLSLAPDQESAMQEAEKWLGELVEVALATLQEENRLKLE